MNPTAVGSNFLASSPQALKTTVPAQTRRLPEPSTGPVRSKDRLPFKNVWPAPFASGFVEIGG